MDKQKHFLGLIAIFFAVILSSVVISCKDDEQELDGWVKFYPPTESYEAFAVNDISGTIEFDEELKSYVFYPTNVLDIRKCGLVQGDCGGQTLSVLLSNKRKDLQDYIGSVSISGTVQFQYAMSPDMEIPYEVRYCYKLTADKIERITRTRASDLGLQEIEVCGTPCSDPPAWLFGRAAYSSTILQEYQFRIFVHVVRSSSGVGFDEAISNTILANLNSYYKGSNISFSLSGTDYIDDDKYNLISFDDARTGDANGLFTKNAHSNAIDIYVISDGKNLTAIKNQHILTLNGRSFGIIATALLINNNQYETCILPHEMGHCLGLYHTHHGLAEDGIPELVNGSNSAVAGDFITDTPADPCEWDGYGNYAGGNLTDANGDKYNPDPLNLMSYSGHPNQGKITPKQVEMIYKVIANESILQRACNIRRPSITGPDMITSSGNYSINVSDDNEVTWNATIETFTSKTASTKQVLTGTGKSFALTNPNPKATSQKFTITATVKNGKGITYKLTKNAYHVIPSTTTGTFKWSSEYSSNPSLAKIGYLDPNQGNSQNSITVYQNGDLFFYYSDACGVNTNNSYFNFVLNDNYSNFTKYPGGNYAYKCNRDAGTGTYSAILQVVAGSYSKIIPLQIQVLAAPYSNEEEGDSLEILSAKKTHVKMKKFSSFILK